MKNIGILLTICGAIIFFSCSRDDEQILPMYTESVDAPDSVQIGQEIRYTIHSILPTPCDEYSHLEQTSSGSDVDVTPYFKRDWHGSCATEAIPVDIPGSFIPGERGIYNFHFWQPQEQRLNLSVIVY